MPVTIDGTSGITTPTYNGADTSEYIVPVTAFKNRIINGDMRIDQRNAGASVTIPASTVTYTVDRFWGFASQASKFTVQQNVGSVTPPTGFINYLGCTSSSAYSVGTSEVFTINQTIEGLNIADLGWGTASASTVTLSFWVRSSLTGTFGGSLRNQTGTRSYPYSYTISSANTWEYKTVTIPGETTGTWATNNGIGIFLAFSLGCGSSFSGTAGSWASANLVSPTGATSVVGTNGATFYITGVQLEKGSTATSFDYRPYGTELALCQRYYENGNYSNTVYGVAGTTTNTAQIGFRVTKRAVPTMAATFNYVNSGSGSVNPIGLDAASATATATSTGNTAFYGTWTATAEL